MSQVLQNLYALQQSKTSTQLKKAYLHFVIQFLAKRQHFEMSELLPLEGLNKHQILAEQKRLLRLLLTATNNDGNGTANLSMEFGNGNRKRRKKRDLLMSILIIYLIVLAAIIEFRHNIRDYGVEAYRRCHGCCFPLRSRGQSSENWQQHEDTIPTAFIVLNLTPATQSNNISVAFRALPEQQMHEANEEEQKLECAVCLGHIEPGTMVRPLPSCKHLFHSECIEHWIKTHNKCPLCRAEPFKINNKGEVTPNYAHCPPTVQEKPAQEHAVQQHPVQGRPEVHEHAVEHCPVHGNSVQQHAVQGHSLLETVHEHTINVGLSETGNAVENV
uniref:RING-type domain-containing protein n=1 Tax=Globodera pallida TaxID=36090 RepID=A0A183CCT2_GLOPA